jgi:hypothetical protein
MSKLQRMHRSSDLRSVLVVVDEMEHFPIRARGHSILMFTK